MLKRYLPFIGVFILTTFLLWLSVAATNRSCYVLDYCAANVEIIPFFKSLFLSVALLVAGIVAYFILRNRVRWNKVKFKYFYWGLLPLLVFYKTIPTVKRHLQFGDIEYSICSKSDINKKRFGINSTNLTLIEYQYLQGLRYELPDLPASSKDITFWFYADDFVVNHMLELTFKCNTNEPIEKSEKWAVESIDKRSGTKLISYSDHDQ